MSKYGRHRRDDIALVPVWRTMRLRRVGTARRLDARDGARHRRVIRGGRL